MTTLTQDFPCFFLICKVNARVKPAKTGHGPHSSYFLCCSMYCLFCVVLCIVCVYMCTVLLPPGGYPIAVKYIIYHIIISYHISISYHIYHIIYHIISNNYTFTEGLTLRRLTSYIYMEHPFLMFLDHTQRRSTVGRTPLDE